MAAAAAVGRLSDPAYVALLPRLSRLLAAGRPRTVQRLIKRASLISVPVMVGAFVIVAALREPILHLLGGQGAEDAAAVLVAGAAAYAINGAAFWNIGVLFAAGRARAVAVIAVTGALAQVALLVPLVLALDATGAALAFLGSMALSNLLMTILALRVIARPGRREASVGDALELKPDALLEDGRR